MKRHPNGVLVVVCTLLSAACASQAPQREGAALLTAHATRVQGELKSFSARRTEVSKERQRNIRDVLTNALDAEAKNESMVASWGVAKKRLLSATLTATTAAADREAKASAALKNQEAQIAAAVSRVNTRSEQLTAAAKALGTLARRDKLRDTLRFYRDFAREARAAIAEAEKEEEASASMAMAKTPEGGPK